EGEGHRWVITKVGVYVEDAHDKPSGEESQQGVQNHLVLLPVTSISRKNFPVERMKCRIQSERNTYVGKGLCDEIDTCICHDVQINFCSKGSGEDDQKNKDGHQPPFYLSKG